MQGNPIQEILLTKDRKLTAFTISTLLVGVFSIALTMTFPSEAASAWVLGLSRNRLALVVVQAVFLLVLAFLYFSFTRSRANHGIPAALKRFAADPANFLLIRNFLLGWAVFFSIAFFYVTLFVPQVLSPFVGWLTYLCWAAYALYRKRVCPQISMPGGWLPSWKHLSKQQQRIALVLIGLALLIFLVLIPVNLRESATPADLRGDEVAQYPVILRMISAKETPRETLYRFFVYGQYEYGFPYYGTSALLAGLVRLCGGDPAGQPRLTLLLLRQLLCVLPFLLSILIFTYLATRFRKWWTAVAAFLLMATLPGVVKFYAHTWHPDALNLLFIALTLFFLDRDRLRFGADFYLAAVACGFSVATRLYGLFFFLAVAGLLTIGLLNKKLTVKKALTSAVLFLLLMAATVMVANPYLFNPGEGGAALRVMLGRQEAQAAVGITDPEELALYRTGLSAWWPTMTDYFGSGITLTFLAVSLLAGLFLGENKHYYRILFAWSLVVGVYLIFFVKSKSFWYLFPFLVPLYSALFALMDAVQARVGETKNRRGFEILAGVFAFAVVGYQLVQNVLWIFASRIF